MSGNRGAPAFGILGGMSPQSNSLHVAINGWFVGRQFAGSGQYLHHLVETLPLVAPEARWTLLAPPHAPDQAWPGVEVVRPHVPALPQSLLKLWWEQRTVPHAARRAGADVLWVPYWAAPWSRRVPCVVTIHDLIPLLLPGYREGVAQRLYNALVAATARRSAAVITVSHAAARDIVQHLGIPGERVRVIHHGPNQPGAHAGDADYLASVRLRYNLPERYFLYLGGFDLRKNVVRALAAYKRYLERGGDPAVKFVLAGALPRADTSFTPDPRRVAGELGLGEQVRYCGWVEEADKPALYALSLGFVFPSLYEGFGMMVLEAMQAGSPVITSAA